MWRPVRGRVPDDRLPARRLFGQRWAQQLRRPPRRAARSSEAVERRRLRPDPESVGFIMSLLGDDTVPNLTSEIQRSSRYCPTCGRTYDSNRQQAACPHDPWTEVADTDEATVALAAPLNDGDFALAPD